MNYQRQIAMVKTVAKNIRLKEKEMSTQDIARDEMYKMLKGINKSVDEVAKADLNQKQYKIIVEFLKLCQGINEYDIIQYYPNFK